MQLIFFKLDTSFNEASSGTNLHQFVSFCIFCISQQNAFASLGLEGLPLVKWYPGPRFGTKNSQMRHWDYTHVVLWMVWPQPLTCGAPYSTNTKHNLLLQPKEKEVDAWHGEGMLPSLSVICSSSQPHHYAMVCMELRCVIFESPLIHRNYGNILWCTLLLY